MKIPMKEKMKKEKETKRLFVVRSLPSRAAWLAEPLKRSAKKRPPALGAASSHRGNDASHHRGIAGTIGFSGRTVL